MTPDGVDPRLKEIERFFSVLAIAIRARDTDVIALTCDSVGRELRDMVSFPGPWTAPCRAGKRNAPPPRAALKALVFQLRMIEHTASDGEFEEAAAAYKAYAASLKSPNL